MKTRTAQQIQDAAFDFAETVCHHLENDGVTIEQIRNTPQTRLLGVNSFNSFSDAIVEHVMKLIGEFTAGAEDDEDEFNVA